MSGGGGPSRRRAAGLVEDHQLAGRGHLFDGANEREAVQVVEALDVDADAVDVLAVTDGAEQVGDGQVVMFSINPFWRNQTQGSYLLVLNAAMNYKNLDAGKK